MRGTTVAAVGVLVATLALGTAAGAAFSGAEPVGNGGVRTAAATTSTRLSGDDRYSTAAAVSAATFSSGAPVAYLATGADFPDALTAAAAAGGRGPVLLASPVALPEATAVELARLHPARVVAVGGTLAIGNAVLASVHASLPSATVSRITGADRYDTAAQLSTATFPNGAPVAYVATGYDYPDALAAAAAAGGRGPVLLARSYGLSGSALTELQRLHVSSIVVVGGVHAVSDAAFLTIAAAVPDAPMRRMSGADRFETAAAVAGRTFASGAAASIVYLATGQNYPDALTAAAAAGGHGPVLLVTRDQAPDSTMTALRALNAGQLVLVGGTNAVSAATETQIRSAVASVVAPPLSERASIAISYARAQLGKPYEWAGAGPNSFDCSGLTMRAWGAAGVTMPHNAAAQAAAFPQVPLSDLAPGDLIFYGAPDIYHVGLYIGGGQMIEAAHSGTPVRIADIHRPELLSAARPA
ncbi:MAG: hypothetical protein NVS3B21_09610 [Acidimicrobiales bacterium]